MCAIVVGAGCMRARTQRGCVAQWRHRGGGAGGCNEKGAYTTTAPGTHARAHATRGAVYGVAENIGDGAQRQRLSL